MDQIMDTVISLIQQILVLVITGVGTLLIAYLKEKFGTEKMKKLGELLTIHKEVIREGILYAQQKFEGSDNAAKLEAAKDYIIARLNDAGLNISEDVLDKLIESVLKETKDNWNTEWNKTVGTTETPLLEEVK